jgi:hypothetical protein
MCTIGGIISEGRAFLLKNFDYPPVPTGWAYFTPFDGGIAHFALVDHGQRGVNSGLNEAGLGLQISRSKPPDPGSEESEEKRTVLNGEILNRFSSVGPALEYVERFVEENPRMYGGNLMLADAECISITEYIGGRSRSKTKSDGYLARANHSVFGLVENEGEGTLERYRAMNRFLGEIYDEIAELDNDGAIARLRKALQEHPVLTPNTRSSFTICIEESRVDYMVGDGPWEKFRFSTSSR